MSSLSVVCMGPLKVYIFVLAFVSGFARLPFVFLICYRVEFGLISALISVLISISRCVPFFCLEFVCHHGRCPRQLDRYAC